MKYDDRDHPIDQLLDTIAGEVLPWVRRKLQRNPLYRKTWGLKLPSQTRWAFGVRLTPIVSPWPNRTSATISIICTPDSYVIDGTLIERQNRLLADPRSDPLEEFKTAVRSTMEQVNRAVLKSNPTLAGFARANLPPATNSEVTART